MGLKFKNHSPRAKWWDYSREATYFITICTKNKHPFFGTINNKTVQLSSIGELVRIEWLKGPEIRPDMNIVLGEFVVMPDHFHALVSIGANAFNQEINCLRNSDGEFMGYNGFQPQTKNLASLIRGFKSAVTIQARQIDPTFKWYKLYHDVIVQSSDAYERIENYIQLNPVRWDEKQGN